MITFENIVNVIAKERMVNQLPLQNYWLYIGVDDVKASEKENKQEGYIGYFIEDDTRLKKVFEIALKNNKRLVF